MGWTLSARTAARSLAVAGLLTVFAGLVIGFAATTASAAAPSASASASAAPALASAAPANVAKPEEPAAPSQATVGAYLYFIRSLDTPSNTFVADFYIWFLWRGERDPTKSFEFMNALGAPAKAAIFVDDAGADTPETLPDGRKYQQYHVQGTFASPMDFSNYPLDRHVLGIEIEDTKSTIRDLEYAVDVPNTSVIDSLNIPGWVRGGLTGAASHVEYRTTFGDPREQGSVQYAHVTFGLNIERPRPSSLINGITPVVITILVGLGALFLRPSEFGSRLSMYAMGVMTVVFVNMDIASKVPEGAGTLLRQVTAICFVILLSLAFAGVRSQYMADKGNLEGAQRFDRWCFAASVGVFVLACAFILGPKY